MFPGEESTNTNNRNEAMNLARGVEEIGAARCTYQMPQRGFPMFRFDFISEKGIVQS